MQGSIFPTVVNEARGLRFASGVVSVSASNQPASGDSLVATSATSAVWQSQGGGGGVTGIGVLNSGFFLDGGVGLVPSGDVVFKYSGNNIVVGASISGIDANYVHTFGSENIAGAKTFSDLTSLDGGLRTSSFIFRNSSLSGTPTTTTTQFMASLITGVVVGSLLATTSLTVGITGYAATSGVFNPSVNFPQGTIFECQSITGMNPDVIITAQVSGTGDAITPSSNAVNVTFHNVGSALATIGTVNFFLLQKKIVT